MCSLCKDDRCIGFILLHEKELKDIREVASNYSVENPKVKFILIGDPDNISTSTNFYQLHVIENVIDDEIGVIEDKTSRTTRIQRL